MDEAMTELARAKMHFDNCKVAAMSLLGQDSLRLLAQAEERLLQAVRVVLHAAKAEAQP